MICGNISNFFFFFFFPFVDLVFFLFFFFLFNLPPPHSFVFGPLRILCLKEIEAIELMLTLSRFTKAFLYLKTKTERKKEKAKINHCFLQPVRHL